MANNNAIRSRAVANMETTITLTFADGSQKIKYLNEGDIIKNLTYKNGKEYSTIEGIVKVINFSSDASESAGIADDLSKSKSVFSKVVRPISLIVDTSEIFKSDVVNVNISDIVNFKADVVVNEKYQGEVHRVDENTSFADAINAAADGDTILLATNVSDAIDINKAVRITAAKDDDNNYIPVEFDNTVAITANNGVVEIDHVSFADITSAEGTGATKNTAKGFAINVTGNADLNVHDVFFNNFNNFYSMIFIAGTGEVTIEDCTFDNGANYHVLEFGGTTPVKKLTVRDNYFGKVCTHNIISAYAFDEAEIVIYNNYFEYSGNAVRLSDTNNGKAVVELLSNTYESTDPTDASADTNCSSKYYAGLVILQDYTGTQDFSNIDLVFTDNYYAPIDGEKILVSEGSENTLAQGYYVYKDKAEYTMTYPNVTYKN